ncbi:MAG: hypothetical protein Q9163_000560 [Psora crenata]
MDASARQGALRDLQQRLSDARLKLFWMDGTEEEYEIKKAALEHKIQSLQNEVQARAIDGYAEEERRADGQHYEDALGDANNIDFSSLPTGVVPYPLNEENSFRDRFASDTVLPQSGGRTQLPMYPTLGADPSDLSLDSPHLVTDDQSIPFSASSANLGFILPQKRQRASITLSNNSSGHPSKSLRTTPSPARSGNTSPTSYDSSEVPDDMLAVLGVDPRLSLREIREEQKLQERIAEKNMEQMRLDEEYARKLSQDLEDLGDATRQHGVGFRDVYQPVSQAVPDRMGHCSRPSPPSSPPFARVSDFPKAVLNTSDRYRQATPFPSLPVTPGPDPFATARLPVKHESPLSAKRAVGQKSIYSSTQPAFAPARATDISRQAPMKQENAQQGISSRHDFIDIDSDSDPISGLNTPTLRRSSDIIELDANAWHNSLDSNTPTQVQRNGYNAYGSNFDQMNSVGWTAPRASVGQDLYNTQGDLGNGVQDLVNFDADSIYATGDNTSPYGAASVGLLEDWSPSGWADNAFSRHGIDANDPANNDLYDRYINRVDYVTHDPTRTAAEIRSLLENIRPDEDLPPENREGTPEAMTYPLMEHQKLGLAWLKKMEESEQKGGILADDMGLGKTIQALALIVSRRSQDLLCKTTLIVAPVALMRQWEREIRTKLKPGRPYGLKTFILHGANRHATWDRLRSYDVVLTTFGTLGSEVKRRDGIEMKKRVNSNWKPTSNEDNLPTLGEECFWYRVIIDEAQCIKNKSTKAAIGACLLKAKTRFCMTGTPMMNSIEELYSLIKFLRISPWMDSQKFSSNFTRPLKRHSGSAKKQAMEKLQVLLKAILLRRTKKSMIDGKPILELPPRTTEAQHAKFSEDETEFYQALQTQTQLQFNKYLKAGTVGRNYSNILVLLLRLRQACCHPHLIRDFGQEGLSVDVTVDDMMKLAKELTPSVIARLIEQSRSNDDSALECPVCMDMTPNATIFLPCGHNTCSECFARITDPSQAIANGDAAETRAGEAKCPNCRGKITPTKVIDHKTFKKVHMREPGDILTEVEEDAQADIGTTDDSDMETDEDSNDEIDSKGNLKDFIVSDDLMGNETGDEDVARSYKPCKKSKSKGKAKEQKPPKKALAQLKKESRSNAKARRRYLRRLEKEWETSAKIEKTMEILRQVQNSRDEDTMQCEKTIIFSQFTSLLDLVEVPINAEGWSYRRYDGSMNANQRNDAVLDFTDKKDIRIILISLKAGNAGLNLTAASQVIILDPFWNPYIEEQAIDRAHRIGQMKPVRVHRILVPDTVEDRILALQEQKRQLIESALDEGASQRIGRLGTSDLAFLFVS